MNAFWRLSHLHGTHGSRFSPSAITLMRARFTARRSFRYDLHDRRGGRFEPHESRMHTIHPAKINLRVCVEDPQPGLAPYSAQVKSEAAVIREGVADPLGAGTVFHNDDDAPAVVEIPYGDTAPFTRRWPTVSMISAFARVYGGRGTPTSKASLVSSFAIRTTHFGRRV